MGRQIVVRGDERAMTYWFMPHSASKQHCYINRANPLSNLFHERQRSVVATYRHTGVPGNGEQETDDVAGNRAASLGPVRAGMAVTVARAPSLPEA